jgi:hypothetical protein
MHSPNLVLDVFCYCYAYLYNISVLFSSSEQSRGLALLIEALPRFYIRV